MSSRRLNYILRLVLLKESSRRLPDISLRIILVKTSLTYYSPVLLIYKILDYSFLVGSNLHSDMKSLNENHVAYYNLRFSLLFNPIFIGFFGVISILKNVDKSVSNLLVIDAG